MRQNRRNQEEIEGKVKKKQVNFQPDQILLFPVEIHLHWTESTNHVTEQTNKGCGLLFTITKCTWANAYSSILEMTTPSIK